MKDVASRKVLILWRFCVTRRALSSTLATSYPKMRLLCVTRSLTIMPGEGLEPTRISPPDPKSGASANSAIRASVYFASLPEPWADQVR